MTEGTLSHPELEEHNYRIPSKHDFIQFVSHSKQIQVLSQWPIIQAPLLKGPPEDVVGSFEAMRRYLREVKKCLERVDPFLDKMFIEISDRLG